jgi:hypothetical protein
MADGRSEEELARGEAWWEREWHRWQIIRVGVVGARLGFRSNTAAAGSSPFPAAVVASEDPAPEEELPDTSSATGSEGGGGRIPISCKSLGSNFSR